MGELRKAISQAVADEKLVPQVLQFSTSIIKPGYQYVDHYYKEVVEIVYVIDGTIYIGVDGRYSKAKVGDCFVIFPGVIHNVYLNKRESCKIRDVLFSLGDITSYGGSELLFLRAIGERKLKYLRFSDSKLLKNLLDSIELTVGKTGDYASISLKMDFCKLCLLLSEKIEEQKLSLGQDENSIAAGAHRYISEAYRTSVSIDGLSKNLGISPRHLSRVFYAQFGMSMQDYINLLRIDKARELLANKEMNITQIAFFLGFNSSGYFTSFFKKHEGISPVAYRKKRSSSL